MNPRRLAACGLLAGLVAVAPALAARRSAPPPRLTLNDYALAVPTVQKANTVFVPAQAFARKFGLTLVPGTVRGLVLRKRGRAVMRFAVGSHAVVINGRQRAFAIAPYVRKGGVMVPLRAAAEAAGAVVGYASSPRTVQIDYRPAPRAVAPPTLSLQDRAERVARETKRAGRAAARAVRTRASETTGESRRWWLVPGLVLVLLALIAALIARRARRERRLEAVPPDVPPVEPLFRHYP